MLSSVLEFYPEHALILLAVGAAAATTGVLRGHRLGASILVVSGVTAAGVAGHNLIFWITPLRDFLYIRGGAASMLLLFFGIGSLWLGARLVQKRWMGAAVRLLSTVLIISSILVFSVGLSPSINVLSIVLALATASACVFLTREGNFGNVRSSPRSATPENQSHARQPERARAPAPPASQPSVPADVFISYKREERARVEAIAKALRELKLSVWFDARLQTGHSFDEEINREVRGAKCVLVCWSQGAVASEWVRAEASIGRQRGVLAACFLQQCELYPPFNLVHAEDLSGGALDASNPAWAKIVEQIGHLVGRPGLGGYVAARDRGALGAWLTDHASDPLADVVLARLRQA